MRLLPLILLLGCALPQQRVFDYPGLGLRIIKTWAVSAPCKNAFAGACVVYGEGPGPDTIYARSSESLTHELCHVEYGDFDHKAECADGKMDWVQGEDTP